MLSESQELIKTAFSAFSANAPPPLVMTCFLRTACERGEPGNSTMSLPHCMAQRFPSITTQLPSHCSCSSCGTIFTRAESFVFAFATRSRHQAGTNADASRVLGRLGDQSNWLYQGSVSHHRSFAGVSHARSMSWIPASTRSYVSFFSVVTTLAFISSNFAFACCW